MIIVDKKLEVLEKTNKPIRVGLIGAGFAARGFALQLLTIHKGMRLVAITNRSIENAKNVFNQARIKNIAEVNSKAELDKNIKTEKVSVCSNYEIICGSDLVDVIVEATGEIEFGANVALSAIKNKKDIILINAELDSTLGPILKKYADENGVIYSQADGDQPAQLMNLYRYVTSIGFKPLLLGNIKSLIDHYRNPTTQEKFAKAHFQRPKHITSFADGTKISFEMATLANASGFDVLCRGMKGPRCSRVEDAKDLFLLEKIKNGKVDYILGAEPSFGVFVLAYSDNPEKKKYMEVYKMGNGPIYTFYIPYHLSPLEAPLSVARAYLFDDAALAPLNGPVCDVITIAKKDLKIGDRLDGIGGYTCYGTIENSKIVKQENLLPMGLSENCTLNKNINKDQAIHYDDVILPLARLCDKLREEQNKKFI